MSTSQERAHVQCPNFEPEPEGRLRINLNIRLLRSRTREGSCVLLETTRSRQRRGHVQSAGLSLHTFHVERFLSRQPSTASTQTSAKSSRSYPQSGAHPSPLQSLPKVSPVSFFRLGLSPSPTMPQETTSSCRLSDEVLSLKVYDCGELSETMEGRDPDLPYIVKILEHSPFLTILCLPGVILEMDESKIVQRFPSALSTNMSNLKSLQIEKSLALVENSNATRLLKVCLQHRGLTGLDCRFLIFESSQNELDDEDGSDDWKLERRLDEPASKITRMRLPCLIHDNKYPTEFVAAILSWVPDLEDMETYMVICPALGGTCFESVPIFCEVDPPTSFVEHVQAVADKFKFDYLLVRKNASVEEYRTVFLGTYKRVGMFLVYDGSGYFMCYGSGDGDVEGVVGVPLSLDSLGNFSLHNSFGFALYGDCRRDYVDSFAPMGLILESRWLPASKDIINKLMK